MQKRRIEYKEEILRGGLWGREEESEKAAGLANKSKSEQNKRVPVQCKAKRGARAAVACDRGAGEGGLA